MKKKNLSHILKNTKGKVQAAGVTGAAILSTTIPTYAGSFSAYNGTSANSIMSGVISFFGTIGTYGGALYGVGAVFTLVLAIRNEDNEGRNKALLNLLAAIGLLSMGVILNLFFKK